MKRKVLKFWGIILILLVLVLNGNYKIKALDYVKKSENTCTETEQYKIWNQLPDDEKNKTMMPVKCKETILISKKILANVGSLDNASNYLSLSRFDLRDVNGKSYVTPSKSQLYDSGTDSNACWAFATASSIESSNLISGGNQIDISEKHMAFNMVPTLDDGTTNLWGYKTHTIVDGRDSGGNYFMSGTYLAQKRGPVLETKVPFSANSPIKSNTLDLKPDYYVNDVYYAMADSCQDEGVIDKIKYMIVNYGAVASYMSEKLSNLSDDKISFYYKGVLPSGHAMSIIGWDDNYPKENFSGSGSGTPENDGAWIVKNTYPNWFNNTSFGVGYHYISYYDSNVCEFTMAVNDVKAKQDDLNLYTHDYLGFDGGVSNSINTIYFKQIYNKKTSLPEVIDSINLFLLSNDSYEIYYSEEDNYASATKIAFGTASEMGYTNVVLNNKPNIQSNKFYIFLKYVATNKYLGMYSFPAFVNNFSESYNIDMPSGVSYYGHTPEQWNDAISNEELEFLPNIYVFTKNISVTYNLSSTSAQPSQTKITPSNGYYYIPLQTNVNLSNITVKVNNSNNVDSTSLFNISQYNNGFKITPKSTVVPGNYTVKFTYQNLSTSQNITISEVEESVQIVEPILVNSISISGLDEVSVGGTLNLQVSIKPENADNKSVKWSSSDTEVATVNAEGIVTGVKAGKATIIAKSQDGSNKSASKTIKVIDINKEEGNTIEINENSAIDNPKTGMSNYSILLVVLIPILLAVVFAIKKISIKEV